MLRVPAIQRMSRNASTPAVIRAKERRGARDVGRKLKFHADFVATIN
jgi:hypothetical protein